MTTLISIHHEGPMLLIHKRNKRLLDYAKYKGIKDRGDKPDKKTQEQGEQFMALNDALKDEIPKLMSLTGKLVTGCLNSFVQIQTQWYTIWQRKLGSMLDSRGLPHQLTEIINQFSTDFAYAEASVLTLGICNGSMLTDAVNLVGFLSPSTSHGGEDGSTHGKPSLDKSRHRGLSLNSESSPSLPHPDFGTRHSDSFTFSPMSEYAPQAPSSGSQAGFGQAPLTGRLRAGSGVSNRGGPTTPDLSGANRSFGLSTPGSSKAPRPSTSAGRNTEPSPSLPRLSVDTPGFNLSADTLVSQRAPAPAESTYSPSGSTYFAGSHTHLPQNQMSPTDGRSTSSFFSSALPMSDSPTPPSQLPVGGSRAEPTFNVLYLVASIYEFSIDRARQQAGYPYLTYGPGEIFDVLGEHGELWLAKNQDDRSNQVGWIWSKHFVRIET